MARRDITPPGLHAQNFVNPKQNAPTYFKASGSRVYKGTGLHSRDASLDEGGANSVLHRGSNQVSIDSFAAYKAKGRRLSKASMPKQRPGGVVRDTAAEPLNRSGDLQLPRPGCDTSRQKALSTLRGSTHNTSGNELNAYCLSQRR